MQAFSKVRTGADGRSPALALTLAFLALALLTHAGCGGPAEALNGSAATAQLADQRAKMTLDQLSPSVAKPVNQADLEGLPTEQIRQAEELIRRQDYHGALQILEPAAKLSPQSGRILRDIGLANAGMGSQAKAEPALQRAAKTAGDSVRLHLLLGQYAQADHVDLATVEFRTAILCSDAKDEDPDTAEAYLRLGTLLERQGYAKAALQCYEKLSSLVADHAREYLARPVLKPFASAPERLLIARGRMLLRLHDNAQAADILERAYQSDKSDPLAGRLAVTAILETADYPRAEAMILEMADDSTQVSQAIELAGELFRRNPRPDYARHLLDAYLHLGGREASFVLAMVEATAQKAGLPAADELLSSHMSAAADGARLTLRLADFQVRLKQYDQAYATAVRLLQDSALEIDQTQALLRRMGSQMPPSALNEVVEKARGSDENKPAALTAAGVLADGAENTQLAQELLKQALEYDADFLPAYLALERLYASEGRFADVAKLLEKLKQIQPPEAFRYYLLARADFDQGRAEQAMLSLEKSLSPSDQRPATLLLLGETLINLTAAQLAMRDVPKAQEYVRQAERILASAAEAMPDDVHTLAAQYELYMLQGKSEDALKAIGAFLRVSPQNPGARALLGRFYLQTNQMDRVRAVAPELAKDSPSEAAMLQVRLDLPDRLPKEPLAATQADPAIARLTEVVTQHPRFTPAGRLLAALLVNQKQYDKAVVVWKSLYRRSPNDPAVVAAYLDAVIKAGRQDEAAGLIQELAGRGDNGQIMQSLLLENLIDINRLDLAEALIEQWLPKVRTRQGLDSLRARAVQVYTLRKEYDRAQALLDRWIIDGAPADVAGHLRQQKMQLFVEAGQFDQAIEYATKWRRNEPANPLPEGTILPLLIDAKQYDKAAALADEWLKDSRGLDSESAKRLYGSKELILSQQKNFPGVLAVHKQWLASQVSAIEPYRMLLAVLIEQKQYDMALKAAQEWLDMQQPMAASQPAMDKLVLESQQGYLEVLIAAAKYKQAEEFARKLVAAHPQSPQALRLLYSVLSSENKHREATAVLEAVYVLDPSDDSTLNDLGYQWVDRGVNIEKAEAMIRKALASRPALAFKDSLGWVLYKQGRFAEAKSLFDQVISSNSSDLHAVILDHAGDNCWRLGMTQEAQRLWTLALEQAKKPQKSDPELKKVLDNTPKKLDAARRGKDANVAPLGPSPQPAAK